MKALLEARADVNVKASGGKVINSYTHTISLHDYYEYLSFEFINILHETVLCSERIPSALYTSIIEHANGMIYHTI